MSEIIEPLSDRVLVKPDDKDTKTSGGLIIPKTAQEMPQQGVVVSSGPTSTLDEGDRVFYGKHSGTDFPGGLKMFNEPNILAVIRKK